MSTLTLTSQYTVWCWVLIDTKRCGGWSSTWVGSQYTVWCWVLIDATFTSRTTTPLTLR